MKYSFWTIKDILYQIIANFHPVDFSEFWNERKIERHKKWRKGIDPGKKWIE